MELHEVLALTLTRDGPIESQIVNFLREAASNLKQEFEDEWWDEHDCNVGEDEDCNCSWSATVERKMQNADHMRERIFTVLWSNLKAYGLKNTGTISSRSLIGGAFHCVEIIGSMRPLSTIKTIYFTPSWSENDFLVLFNNGAVERVPYQNILNKVFGVTQDGCEVCGTKHTQYGLEAEILAMPNDMTYRDALLRKLNRKLHIHHGTDKFGIDGSGVPLEIRNINGQSIGAVVNNYKSSMDRLLDGVKFMSKNFPYVNKTVSLNCCGIHVHQFHEKIERNRLATVHSLVGMLVNSLEPLIWRTRTQEGYGTPFNFRSPPPWCQGEYATELRVFNVLHPETLRCAMELTSELAKKPLKAISQNQYEHFRIEEARRSLDIHRRIDVTEGKTFNRILGFLVEQGAVEMSDIRMAYKKLRGAYAPVLGKRSKVSGMPEIILNEKIIGFKPKPVKIIKKAPPVPVAISTPTAEQTRGIGGTSNFADILHPGYRDVWDDMTARPAPWVAAVDQATTTCDFADVNSTLEFCANFNGLWTCNRPPDHAGPHHAHNRDGCVGGDRETWPQI